MTCNAAERAPFHWLEPAIPPVPVVIAVPHAGRDYPTALLAQSRVDQGGLEHLEDRHADLLVPQAVAEGAAALVAHHARAWIDLNRDERELDPGMVADLDPSARLIASPKSRGGLGLIPRRLTGLGDLLRGPLPHAAVIDRIMQDHRPYHEALARRLADTRRRHGIAVLLDCHSMPSLERHGVRRPQIVIGDRFGRSAGSRFSERIAAEAEAASYRVARNDPYAGGYTLDRHGAPRNGVHALQIEIDRTLYLEADGRTPGDGVPAMQSFVAAIAAALAEECGGWRVAAE